MNSKIVAFVVAISLLFSARTMGQGKCNLATTQVEWTMNACLTSPCEFLPGSGGAFASATSVWIYLNEPNHFPVVCVQADASSFTGYITNQSASADCGSSESAASVSLSPQCISLSLESRAQNGICTKGPNSTLISEGAGAGAYVNTTVTCNWTFEIELAGQIQCPTGTGGDEASLGAYWVQYLDEFGNLTTRLFGPDCDLDIDECGEFDSATVSISGGPGPISFGIIPVGDQLNLDFNGDGRLNQVDLDAIAALLPVMFCDAKIITPVMYYDFDGDCDVDSADLALLQEIVDFLGDDVAGDESGDGLVNCDDLPGVISHSWASVFTRCDVGYRGELDYDLDGDNDIVDRNMILLSIQPADYSTDGVINFFDWSAFSTAYNTMSPMGDFNGDGQYTYFDISDYLAAYNAPCP